MMANNARSEPASYSPSTGNAIAVFGGHRRLVPAKTEAHNLAGQAASRWVPAWNHRSNCGARIWVSRIGPFHTGGSISTRGRAGDPAGGHLWGLSGRLA